LRFGLGGEGHGRNAQRLTFTFNAQVMEPLLAIHS
jgi:hypothetical protein